MRYLLIDIKCEIIIYIFIAAHERKVEKEKNEKTQTQEKTKQKVIQPSFKSIKPIFITQSNNKRQYPLITLHTSFIHLHPISLLTLQIISSACQT